MPVRSNPILEKLAPLPGRYPLLPDLSPQQELALLCRMLHREGYDDHIAGHITVAQSDGSFLVNPWELAWDELTAADIIRVNAEGRVIEVTAKGEMVREYNNLLDDRYNAIITYAEFLPEGYLTTLPECRK